MKYKKKRLGILRDHSSTREKVSYMARKVLSLVQTICTLKLNKFYYDGEELHVSFVLFDVHLHLAKKI